MLDVPMSRITNIISLNVIGCVATEKCLCFVVPSDAMLLHNIPHPIGDEYLEMNGIVLKTYSVQYIGFMIRPRSKTNDACLVVVLCLVWNLCGSCVCCMDLDCDICIAFQDKKGVLFYIF